MIFKWKQLLHFVHLWSFLKLYFETLRTVPNLTHGRHYKRNRIKFELNSFRIRKGWRWRSRHVFDQNGSSPNYSQVAIWSIQKRESCSNFFEGSVRPVWHNKNAIQGFFLAPQPSKSGITPRKELQMGKCQWWQQWLNISSSYSVWIFCSGLENGIKSLRLKAQVLFSIGPHTTSEFGSLMGSTGLPMCATWGTMWSTRTRRCGTLPSLSGGSVWTKPSSNLTLSTKREPSLQPRFEKHIWCPAVPFL